MNLVSIVQEIAESDHFSADQLPTKQRLKTIVAEGLQAIDECSTHFRRVEYERNLYYKMLNNVAPQELEKLYHQIVTLENTLDDSDNHSGL